MINSPEEHGMSHERDDENPERVFTLFEANQLIPQLQSHLATVQVERPS